MGLGTPLVTPAKTPLLLPPGTAIAPCPGAKQRQRGMPRRYLRSLHVGKSAVTALLILALSEISSDPHPEQQPVNHTLEEAVPWDCL